MEEDHQTIQSLVIPGQETMEGATNPVPILEEENSQTITTEETVSQDTAIQERIPNWTTDEYNYINKELTNRTKSGKKVTIDNLFVFPDFISKTHEEKLIEFIQSEFDRRKILRKKSPRMMYYGMKDFKCQDIIPPIPESLYTLMYQLIFKELFPRWDPPECIEIKEYYGKQGVAEMKNPSIYKGIVTIFIGCEWCIIVNTKEFGNRGFIVPPRTLFTFDKETWGYEIPQTYVCDIKNNKGNKTLRRGPDSSFYSITFKKLKSIDPDFE